MITLSTDETSVASTPEGRCALSDPSGGCRLGSSSIRALPGADDEHRPHQGGANWHLSGTTIYGRFRTNSVRNCPAAMAASRQGRVPEAGTSWLSSRKPGTGCVSIPAVSDARGAPGGAT